MLNIRINLVERCFTLDIPYIRFQMANQLIHVKITTPIGEMDVLATENGICLLEFFNREELNDEITAIEDHFKITRTNGTIQWIELMTSELNAYFRGSLQKFTVPLDLIGTDFQTNVWNALLEIPYGRARTYKEQALALGDLKAILAVAAANGKNKLAIIVPCHRVIGTDGNLKGYAGGLDRKRFLLNLEREIAGPKDLFNS
ncbi:MAG: methylated-DNA--[protein]-cysteine S-methyltransferase [Crocinitomix sp.]|nr:methylated-DNA--[protein]-cysteine S-methyltransferase [Crocinitomix sp.]